MALSVSQFFKACNPTKTLDLSKPEEAQFYVDFSAVRGSDVVNELQRTIVLSEDEPTCQLFTGHIGCGKSTELSRLKTLLEQQGYHVVYFESSEDLDMADVDISDILLAIAPPGQPQSGGRPDSARADPVSAVAAGNGGPAQLRRDRV